MQTEDLVRITDEQVADYRRNGAICLRGCCGDWVAPLRRGVERNIAAPGPIYTDHRLDGGGRFFEDYRNWQRIPEYRDFVLSSPAAAALQFPRSALGSHVLSPQAWRSRTFVKQESIT